MALNTAPSFMSPAAKSASRMSAQPLAKRVGAQRSPMMPMGPTSRTSGSSRAGIARSPFMNFGFDGAKAMGNLGNPKSMSMGYNPSGGMPPMGGGGPIANSPGQRFQGPPLMDSGMVSNNAPMPMGGSPNMGGGMPPGVFSEAYGGGEPPIDIGSMRNRSMDPRFRY